MAKKRDFSELFNREKPMLEVRELKKLYPQKNGKLLSFHGAPQGTCGGWRQLYAQ